MRPHWYAVNKGNRSNKNLVALFRYDQGASHLNHGLSMVYVICTSSCVHVYFLRLCPQKYIHTTHLDVHVQTMTSHGTTITCTCVL